MEPEFGHMPVHETPYSGDFPAFSLVIRDLAGETSSLQTAPTAIQSAAAETSGAHRGFGRERPAIPRALAVSLWRIRTGDCGLGGQEGAASPVCLCCQVRRFGFALDSPGYHSSELAGCPPTNRHDDRIPATESARRKCRKGS